MKKADGAWIKRDRQNKLLKQQTEQQRLQNEQSIILYYMAKVIIKME